MRWTLNANPGSQEAIDAGCICAVMDNCRGRFPPWPPDGWWITVGCPVHHPDEPGETASGVDSAALD